MKNDTIDQRQLFSFLKRWATKENPKRADEISRAALTPLQYHYATTVKQPQPTLNDEKKI